MKSSVEQLIEWAERGRVRVLMGRMRGEMPVEPEARWGTRREGKGAGGLCFSALRTSLISRLMRSPS